MREICRCLEGLVSEGKLAFGHPVLSDNAADLIRLLSEHGFRVKCRSCTAAGYQSSVIYLDLEKRFFWIAIGDAERHLEDAVIRSWAEKFPGFQARRFDSYSDFREEVMAVLRERRNRFIGFLNELQRLAGEWRECGPSEMAAAEVALTGDISGMRILAAYDKNLEGEVIEAVEVNVGTIQATAWLMMLIDWANFDGVTSIEADLTRYVDQVPLLGDCVDQFIQIVTDGEAARIRESGNLLTLCHYYAIIVSILRRAGREPDRKALDGLFFAWLLSELVVRQDPEAFPEQYRVSAERIRKIVPKESKRSVTLAWANELIKHKGMAGIDEIIPVATDGGLEDAEREIYASLTFRAESTADRIANLGTLLEGADDIGERRFLLRTWTLNLLDEGKIEEFAEVVDFFLSVTAPADQPRTRLWAAYECSDRGRLDISDRWTRDWPPGTEAVATADLRVEWTVVRCHILRRQGHFREALALADSVSGLSVNDRVIAQLNVVRARLLRDIGDVAGALEILEGEARIPERRWPGMLQTLGASLARYGQYRAALGYAMEAFRMALDNRVTWPPEIFGGDVLLFQALLGLPLDPLCLEEVLQVPATQFPATYAITMQAVLLTSPPAGHDGWKVVERAVAIAPDILASSLEQGDFWLCAQWVGALLDGLLAGMPDIDADNVLDACAAIFERALVDVALGAKVILLILENSLESIRPLLPTLYEGRAARFGESGGRRVDVAEDKATDIVFRKIVHKVLELPDSTPEDLRILADAERSSALRAGHQAWLPNDAGLTGISPQAPPVTVVEWLSDISPVVLITCLDPGRGLTKSLRAEAPDINLSRLSARMRSRLSAWHQHRVGDAFGNPDWLECERWLRGLVEQNISPDCRLVIIRPPTHSSLPWHRAVLDLVGCTYESSWFGLRGSILAKPMALPATEGVAICPRENEDSRILTEMDGYLTRIISVQPGPPLQQVTGTECTRESLAQLLNTSGMVSLFLHGVANSESGVSLAVSADGNLPRPVRIDVADGAERSSFGWRDMLAVDRSPDLIFSVACGSGTSAEIGWNDSAGVFGALRRRGLRSFVGPQWDVDPGEISRLLLTMRAGVLEGEAIGEVYRRTLLRAEDEGISPWSSYALTLEGNWL